MSTEVKHTTNDNNKTQASRLAEAAQELVKAAYTDSEAIKNDFQRKTCEEICEIKSQSIAIKTDMNNKLNQVNQNLQNMNAELEAIRILVKSEMRRNRIVDALKLVEFTEEFKLCANYQSVSSKGVFRQILYMFLKGNGYYIDQYHLGERHNDTDANRKLCRDKISSELGSLLGVALKVTKSEMLWAIFLPEE